MANRSIILKSITQLASRTSRRTISTKSISRAVEDYFQAIDTVAVSSSLSAISFSKFVEITAERPVTLNITPNGGTQFSIPIQNYFCFTVPSGGLYSLVVENEDDALTAEVNILYS